MRIKEIRLLGFRKLKDRYFAFNDSFNLVIGRNGTGKTTLLEAIYLLSTGKSFNTTQVLNCITFGEEYFFVGSTLHCKDGEKAISYLQAKEKRELKLNDKRLKGFSTIIGEFPVIFMNYSLVDIVKGGPESRREFINHCLIFIDRGYYKDIVKYYALLEKRNAHLKAYQPDMSFLKVISEEMHKLSQSIAQKRKDLIEEINARLGSISGMISGSVFPIAISYVPSEAEKLIGESFIRQDIEKKRTSFGIHLDSIVVTLNGNEAREYASLGEAYTVAFALKFIEKDLVKAKKGEEPVLLLDDFFSDLDEGRRENILKLVSSEQVFITSTSSSLLEPKLMNSSKVILM